MKFFDPLFSQLQTIWVGFVQMIPQLLLALIVVAVTGLLARLFSRMARLAARKARTRRALSDLVQTLTGILVWILGILIAATILFPSLTPAELIGALGIAGIAIGLAFKDIFENFMAGIMIMIRKPMRIGDVIEVEDTSGKVEEITIRDTYIREMSGELVLVPNSYLFKNPVEILTDRELRRYELIVGVAYGENAGECRDLIEKTAAGVDGIDAGKGVEVYATEFGASSIDFRVRWWADSAPRTMHQTRSNMVIAIKAALDEAGIEIPFPYRTLTFAEPLPVEMQGSGKDSSKAA
ncbi:mechanosensitive ion channel family protein [Hyphobacterium sp.]|jgi:small-conductance mechanosensitive channel|uniref:mechanosensitive ion channel family protein n=1 Tax=Hyphobacterium sp. TaxID=2004662 RepID=UPI003BAA742A